MNSEFGTILLNIFSAEIWTWLWTRSYQKILTGFTRTKGPSKCCDASSCEGVAYYAAQQ